MAGVGFEVFNADGTLALGLTTRTSRVLGVVENVGGYQGAAGTIIDARFSTGTPFCIVMPSTSAVIPVLIEAEVKGNTLTWLYRVEGGKYPPGAGFLVCNILYGVY